MNQFASGQVGGPLSARGAVAVAMLGGALAALGQAPFDLWPLAPLGLGAIIWLCASVQTPRRAGMLGLAGGFGYFAVALHWLVEPFLVDAATHGWMAPFALILFALGMAVFWALGTFGAARLWPVGWMRVLAIAPVLMLAEAVRGTVLSGFPWAMPGHALIGSPYLALSGWGGGLGLTLLVLAVAALLAGLAMRPRGWFWAGLVWAVFTLPITLPAPQPMQAVQGAPTIRLVQPNAPQHLKWLPEMVPIFWQRGLDLTAAAPASADMPPPDLVVWPETSLPVLLGRSDAARARLALAAGGAQVVIGAQRFEGLFARNALVQLDGAGEIVTIYDKHRLVPFGEYMPARALFDRLDIVGLAQILPVGYAPGPGPQVLDLGDGLGRVFAMICYEAIFPRYIREIGERPDWIVHITNDAWFGTFSGPWQHLALAQLRAAEQGLPVLRAANTGVSAVIDGRGTIVSALPLGEAGHLDAALPSALPATFFARAGTWPVLVLAFVWLLGAFCLRLFQKQD